MTLFLTKPSILHLCKALFRGTYWLRFWSQLQSDDDTKEMFRKASSMLEVIALEQANRGWKYFNRLASF